LQVGKTLVSSIAPEKKKKTILIGKDTRISGYLYESALTSGICSMGSDVLLTGPLPTPAVSHLTKSMAADIGIMISASHNPAEDNGIKFFSSDGCKFNDDIEKKVEDHILDKKEGVGYKSIGKAYRVEDADSRYLEYVKSTIGDLSLDGIKIVLDCANGAAYKVAPLALRELKAKVVSMNTVPNGLNINLNCGVFSVEPVVKKVLSEKADLGVVLDGDADRVAIIDNKGNKVDGDALLSVAAISMQKRGILKKSTVVSTVMANLGFHELMKQHRIKVEVVPVGDKYVIDAMRKGGYNLGGEQSGHIIFSDESNCADGLITALKILEIMVCDKKKLSEIVKYKPYPQILINLPVKSKPKIEGLVETQRAIKDGEKRFRGHGRVLVRYSGTQNIVRIMVEGNDERDVKMVSLKIMKVIKKEIGIEEDQSKDGFVLGSTRFDRRSR
jgi:phosphoglucosamine mutase